MFLGSADGVSFPVADAGNSVKLQVSGTSVNFWFDELCSLGKLSAVGTRYWSKCVSTSFTKTYTYKPEVK